MEAIARLYLFIAAFILLFVWLASKHVFQGKPKPNKKTRTVRFRPVLEGNKFERRKATNSQPIETMIKEHILSKSFENNIQVSYIENVDHDFAFMLRNVLTANECKELIAAAESTGFEQRRFSGKGDDSSSCCFQSNVLANDVIFQRIKPFLPKTSYFDADYSLTLNELTHYSSNDNQVIECYGRLSCLNTSCRVEKYRTKEHLKIHRDGCVLVPNTKDTFTIYAILIYLNDDYDGGNTRFCIDIDPAPKDNTYPYSFLDVKGNIGDALVFRHEILHKGGSVDKGTKYILRLDAGYEILR